MPQKGTVTREIAFHALESAVAAISEIPRNEWLRVVPFLRFESFSRGEIVCRAGEVSGEMFFLAEGIVREYYEPAPGQERIRSFIRGGRFFGSYTNVTSRSPSSTSAQCLTDCAVVRIPFDVIESRREALCWEKLNRRMLECLYSLKERREFEFLALDASERYAILLEDMPGLDDAVAHYHIASYLGITPVQLSRIRSKRKQSMEPAVRRASGQ